jgi:hypothetical protein
MMTGFSKLMAGTALAITLGAGAMVLSGAARAESWSDNCSANGVCVRVQCYDDGACTRASGVGDPPLMQRIGYYDDDGYYHPTNGLADRPSRYACDADGDNCHWTRNYYYDDVGTPVYDPDMNVYP